MQIFKAWWQGLDRAQQEQYREWRNSALLVVVVMSIGLLMGGIVLAIALGMSGIVLAYVGYEWWQDHRRHIVFKAARRQMKERLLLEIGSLDNEVALTAVESLRQEGWLTDGSLARLRLQGTDLRRAELWGSIMPQINLGQALLAHANLEFAEMEEANLDDADLSEANLRFAKLTHASLQRTCLRGAQLVYTHLEGTDLSHADLCGAEHLDKAEFSHDTILPDGSRWQPDCDLERFSNPDHPQFWERPSS